MRIGFLLARDVYGRLAGSSRIRGDWVIKYWPEAERWVEGRRYDVLVFQKVYKPVVAKRFRGLKVFDICDLDNPRKARRMADACDVVTAPNARLLEPFGCCARRHVVKDRHDLEFYDRRKRHRAGLPRMAAWFGFACNFPAAESLIRRARERIAVKVISNEPCAFADVNVKYDDQTVNDELLEADIVLDPRGPECWKNSPADSHKTQHANLLNLPVAHDEEELARLCESTSRDVAVDRWELDVRRSVEEMRDIVA